MKRFWSKVRRTRGCWWWIASTVGGYGQFKVDGKMVLAHRFAWTLTYGAIPDRKWVLHSCDNPRCVKPAHLFLGTVIDNNRDARTKGRHRYGVADNRGASNGHARLCVRDVREIRRRGRRETLTAIARSFRISIAHAGRIVRRAAWAEVN
jgi:hypothetical protein